MTRHGIVTFVDAPKQTVASFEARCLSEARQVNRLFADARCTVFALGREGPVLRSWNDGKRFTVAFGSAVSLLPRQTSDSLGRSFREGAIRSEISDLVAVSAESGSVTAITGDGAHRLFHRDLPSGGSVTTTSLALAVRADGETRVDRSYEDFFLGFGFLPDRRTMFEGVTQLPVRSIHVLTDGETHRIEVQEESGEPASEDGDLLDHLFAATERLSQGVDHCAVFLGGFDSALVCALLRKLGKEVTAYTFDFGDPRYNQANIPLVVEKLGIDHRWVRIDPDRMRAALRDLPYLLNSPGAQPHYQLNTVFASEDAVGDGFGLAFTGDGCDAIFLGYPTVNTRSQLMGRIKNVPTPMARTLLRIMGSGWIEQRLGHVARIIRSVLRASLLSYPASGHLPTQYLDESSLSSLRVGDAPESAETVEEIRRRLAEGLEGLDPKRLAFKGNGATGASRIKVDGSVMTTGLAQVTPFKDSKVVEFANALPSEALRPAGSRGRDLGKQYLIDRVIASGLLPEDVVLQPKQSPSTSPIDYWYMSALRSDVLELLGSLPFEWASDYVENLLRPKWAEEWYRKRIALSPHALQAVGLLVSYASFSRIAD